MYLEDFLDFLKIAFFGVVATAILVAPVLLIVSWLLPEQEVVCLDGKPVKIVDGTVYKAEGSCDGQR